MKTNLYRFLIFTVLFSLALSACDSLPFGGNETIQASGTFFLYAGLTLPAIWFIWKFIPETRGKSLEEIEQFWLKHKKEDNCGQ